LLLALIKSLLYYSAPVGVWSIVINPSVCLSTSTSISLNRWTDRHEILYADPLWPWLGLPLAALSYAMYFQFYGWRHVWP